MNTTHFDALIRSLSDASSRRGVLQGLAAATVGLAALYLPGQAEGRKKRKRRKKGRKNSNNTKTPSLQLNAFGCVDVGDACRGNSANCCSGICQGKKPKNGDKDKSRCVAHNVADCQAGQDTCAADGPTDCAEGSGFCFQTTGKASFCAAAFSGACRACTKDTDCEAEFGAGAACAVCAESCGDSLNLCASPRA